MAGTQKQKDKRSVRILPVLLAVVLIVLSAILFYVATWPKYARKEFYGDMTDELRDSDLYEDMQSGKSFCFIGDSITEGSMIWGVTWYDPLKPYISGEIINFSHSGWTTGDLIERKDEIPAADIYVIAIGVNDVLYPDDAMSASSGEEYVSDLEMLTDALTTTSPEARIYYIAPWILIDLPQEITDRRDEYSRSLEEWCTGDDRIFIDPVPVIRSVLDKEDVTEYMNDTVHPNMRRGVGLYSYAVLLGDHQRRT